MQTRYRWVPTALLLLGISACSITSGSDDDDFRNDLEFGEHCDMEQRRYCASGYTCLNGMCTISCDEHEDCSVEDDTAMCVVWGGTYCGPSCTSDADCESDDYTCVEGEAGMQCVLAGEDD